MPQIHASDPTALRDAVVGMLEPFVPQGEDALSWLGALSPAALAQLDQRLRNWWVPRIEQTDLTGTESLRQAEPALRDAALFLASASRNGRARQQALAVVSTMPGRLSLAAALLRCNDWVAPIRHAAEVAAMSLLEQGDAGDIHAMWPLAARLRSAGRVDDAWIDAQLEPWLRAPAQHRLLTSLLSHSDARTRLYAYGLAFGQATAWAAAVRRDALHDTDPTVARLALRHLLANAREEDVVALCRHALDAPSGQVRLHALRALAERQAPDLPALLDKAVFDRSGGVRALSTWLRQQRGQRPSLQLWRDEVDSGRQGRRRPALEGLADHAQAEDKDRLLAALSTSPPRGQRTCLRGLIRAEGGVTLDVLLASLEHRNAALRSAIDRAQPLWAATITPVQLQELGQLPISGVARSLLLATIVKLPRWHHLELLLDHGPTPPGGAAWQDLLVENWLSLSDRYTPLTAARRHSLLERVRQGGHGLSASQADRVAQALASA